MARQDSLRLGFPPRHRREDDHDRADVGAGAHEHADNWRDDGLLQVHPSCGLLAVAQSVVQRVGQLHQQERRRHLHRETNRGVVRAGNRRRRSHRPQSQPRVQGEYTSFSCVGLKVRFRARRLSWAAWCL